MGQYFALISRQAEIIETWAQSRDLVITRIYKDIGAKRSEGDNVVTRKDFQKPT